LRRTGRAHVTLVERQATVGGNAGSFEWAGQALDFGSHRLHYACDPAVLADIRALLGGELLDRPRNGRIRLRGNFVRFPLKPADLLLRLDRGFALRALRDMAAAPLRRRAPAQEDTFAAVLLRSLGPTICRDFYFPYARKIWGREPAELSGIQARRRVTANSFAKLLRRLVKPVGAGRFYYPRRGFGAITQGYADHASSLGAELLLETSVVGLHPPARPGGQWRVEIERRGARQTTHADYVWSTIPITLLARTIDPGPPPALLRAAGEIDYRAMILVYLQLDVDRFTTTDAHYFPEANIAITRLSEPKNYSASASPRGTTVLCAELPCSPTDAVWSMSDQELADRVVQDIRTAGLPPARPVAVHVKRLRHAYPIYLRGYEAHFGALDAWVADQPSLLTFGRQGLFAHDNTHHALYMAYSAVECLEHGAFDEARWAGFRQIFATHVVED
jgi:protoporphyrinogen oxidase